MNDPLRVDHVLPDTQIEPQPEAAEQPAPLFDKPLRGVKVVEFGTLIAGPFCSRILAEFGAEVIKIESPDGGDPLRKWRKLSTTGHLAVVVRAGAQQEVGDGESQASGGSGDRAQACSPKPTS